MWFSKKPFRFNNWLLGSHGFNDWHYSEAKRLQMMNGLRKESRFCSLMHTFNHSHTSVKSRNENLQITPGAFISTPSHWHLAFYGTRAPFWNAVTRFSEFFGKRCVGLWIASNPLRYRWAFLHYCSLFSRAHNVVGGVRLNFSKS